MQNSRIDTPNRYEQSGELTLLIPGMLYDSSDPPSKSILQNISRELIGCEAFYYHSGTYLSQRGDHQQIPFSDQVDSILEDLDVLGGVRKIQRLSIISHSVGSIVAGNLFYKLDPEIPIGPILSLSPPPILDIRFGASIIKEAITSLIGSAHQMEGYSDKTESFIGDSGKIFTTSERVWESIESSIERYAEYAEEPDTDMHVIIGRQDRVFEPSKVLNSFTKAKRLVLDDTHSLKKQTSINIVAGLFKSLIRRNDEI